jgi:streptogramin lyase
MSRPFPFLADVRRFTGFLPSVALAAALSLPGMSPGATLYVATARGYVGLNDAIGRLFEVDLPAGKLKAIGAIKIGTSPIGICGLARHPKSGVLYGITLPSAPSFPSHLVTIDPATGAATSVGPLGGDASDINFDAQGRLYVWLSDKRRLGQVDLSTGKATAFDIPGLEGESGGLAIDGTGIAFLAVTSARGKLTRVDLNRRQVLSQIPLIAAPYDASINSLTFSPTGLLVGVNSDGGTPPRTMLVGLDPTSGHVGIMAGLPEDSDGLAFSPDAPGAMGAGLKSKRMLLAASAALFVLLFLVGYLRWRKPKPRDS